MTHVVRSRRLAEAAYGRVSRRESLQDKDRERYVSFAKSFPTLIHTCGLAQAAAFALTKNEQNKLVLADLAAVLECRPEDGNWAKEFHKRILELKDYREYMRLTRQALDAATWIKRYTEAILDQSSNTPVSETDGAKADD